MRVFIDVKLYLYEQTIVVDADNLMHIGSITCKYSSCITDAFDFYVCTCINIWCHILLWFTWCRSKLIPTQTRIFSMHCFHMIAGYKLKWIATTLISVDKLSSWSHPNTLTIYTIVTCFANSLKKTHKKLML